MEKEIQQLINNDIGYSNLTIGNVTIVTPYHKIMDALGAKNSSTLKGMSPSHSSKVRKSGLRLDDLFNDVDSQRRIINRDIKIYEDRVFSKAQVNINLGFDENIGLFVDEIRNITNNFIEKINNE